MTDMKTKATEVLYAYMDVEKDLSQPKILIHTLKELINQLQYQSFHHTEEYYQLDASDILKLCEELDTL